MSKMKKKYPGFILFLWSIHLSAIFNKSRRLLHRDNTLKFGTFSNPFQGTCIDTLEGHHKDYYIKPTIFIFFFQYSWLSNNSNIFWYNIYGILQVNIKDKLFTEMSIIVLCSKVWISNSQTFARTWANWIWMDTGIYK